MSLKKKKRFTIRVFTLNDRYVLWSCVCSRPVLYRRAATLILFVITVFLRRKRAFNTTALHLPSAREFFVKFNVSPKERNGTYHKRIISIITVYRSIMVTCSVETTRPPLFRSWGEHLCALNINSNDVANIYEP
jgi:hypothetical protein